jgi:hypothetical protein
MLAYVPERSHTFSLLVNEDTIARLAAESSGVVRTTSHICTNILIY